MPVEEEALPPTGPIPAEALDLEALAREIFEILLREMQLENERTGR